MTIHLVTYKSHHITIMKAIIISIKPQYAAAIYAGTKTYELRKCQPHVEVGTPMLIYETSPVKRITGVAYYSGTSSLSSPTTS